MKIKINLLCLGICLVFTNPVFSQPDSLKVSTLSIKFSPQHLFVSGYHLEFEKSLHANSRHSLIFSPRVYYGNTLIIDGFNDRNEELDEQNRVNGYGVALQHRVYLPEQQVAQQGMYVAYGLDYHQFEISFEKQGYVKEVTEEGIEYYKYRQRNFSEQIKRMGVVGMGGLQVPIIKNRVFTDVSFGIGYRHSDTETDYPNVIFNKGTSDFGYTGLYVLANFKIGIPL